MLDLKYNRLNIIIAVSKNDKLNNVNNCTILAENPLNLIKYFFNTKYFYKINKY